MATTTSIYTPQEQKMTNKLNQLFTGHGYTIKYYIGTPMYTVENLLPLYFAHPTELVYSTDTNYWYDYTRTINYIKNTLSLDVVKKSEKDILNWLTDDKHILIMCTGVTPFNTKSNCIVVSHGVDEDPYWVSVTRGEYLPNYHKMKHGEYWYSLVYSKINEKLIPKDYTEHIKKFYEIDPTKKTILYINSALFKNKKKTLNKYDGYEFSELNETKENIINDLIELKKTYNIIIRLHPLSKFNNNNILVDNFKISNNTFPYFLPFVKMADIVIGPPNGVIVASTVYESKKLICLSPIYNKKVAIEVMGYNKEFLLNEDNCTMVYPENPNLVEAVNAANKNHSLFTEKRNQYVKYWLKDINGYENYKQHILIAKDYFKLDIAEEILKLMCQI